MVDVVRVYESIYDIILPPTTFISSMYNENVFLLSIMLELMLLHVFEHEFETFLLFLGFEV